VSCDVRRRFSLLGVVVNHILLATAATRRRRRSGGRTTRSRLFVTRAAPTLYRRHGRLAQGTRIGAAVARAIVRLQEVGQVVVVTATRSGRIGPRTFVLRIRTHTRQVTRPLVVGWKEPLGRTTSHGGTTRLVHLFAQDFQAHQAVRIIVQMNGKVRNDRIICSMGNGNHIGD
jgi:hypothetical protein